MKKIRDLRGLGVKSEETLAKVNISSVDSLREVGSVAAVYRLKVAGFKLSLNFLDAMVGGLTDRSWLEVAQSEREQLLAELESIELLEQMFLK